MDEKIYKLDYDKITTVEDVVKILKLLDIGFGSEVPGIEECKHLLKLVDRDA